MISAESRYRTSKTVVPQQTEVYGSELYESITVLERAEIDKKGIRKYVACMEARDGFDEYAKRVEIVVRRD